MSHNQIEYISQQTNEKLFDILNDVNAQLENKKDNILEIIKNKIIFVLKTRFDK